MFGINLRSEERPVTGISQIADMPIEPRSLEDLKRLSDADLYRRYDSIAREIDQMVAALRSSPIKRLSPANGKRMARLVAERRKLDMVTNPNNVAEADIRHAY